LLPSALSVLPLLRRRSPRLAAVGVEAEVEAAVEAAVEVAAAVHMAVAAATAEAVSQVAFTWMAV